MLKRWIAFLILVAVLSACAPAAPQASATPTLLPSPSPQPPTVTLTSAPSATRTPNPTATRTASPQPTATLTATRHATPLLRVTEVAGQQCPFNLPVKVVAPGMDAGGFELQAVITPMGDACVSRIKVAPNDARTWYVGGQNALYITRDDGKTWERSLTGQVSAIELDPSNPQRVLVGFQVARTLYESTNQGRTWKLIKTFDQGIMSLLVAGDGTLFVGPHWSSSTLANGIYISRDGGATWQHSSFGSSQRGLIVWTIAQDAQDKTLFAGTEIYDHPKPYKPPVFRSRDGGQTWQEITGTLPWHVIDIAVTDRYGYVYALTEGAGFYGSGDKGDHWTQLGFGPTLCFIIDPNFLGRMFGGAVAIAGSRMEGGMYITTDGGRFFNLVGLRGVTVSSLALSSDRKTLLAVAYSSGIYRVRLPD